MFVVMALLFLKDSVSLVLPLAEHRQNIFYAIFFPGEHMFHEKIVSIYIQLKMIKGNTKVGIFLLPSIILSPVCVLQIVG